ncbi:MAG: cell division protein ZapA [Candidatus Marinimicrobia bacterium]|nr:cell division protein ZapA [Candidatus Neomarinimicrobiota bacterium]
MDDQSSLVRVSIFGQEYTVKAPADASYIKNIAEYVDKKMREVQDGLSSDQSSTRIAILAAMNVADELFMSRKDKDVSSGDIDSRITSLIEMIDESLIG